MIVKKSLAISWLLRLQSSDWQNTISYKMRFLLCGILSYLSFSVLNTLKNLITGKENEFINLFFESPSSIILAILIIVIGYLGLYLTVVTAALFSSLLPKT